MAVEQLCARASATVVLALILLGTQPTATTAVGSWPTPTNTANTDISLPTTVPGARLADVLRVAGSGRVSATEYDALFAPSFTSMVPRSQLLSIFSAALGPTTKLDRVLLSTPAGIAVVAKGAGGLVKIELTVRGDSKIDGLLLSPFSDAPPPAAPSSWADLDTRIRKSAPTVRFVAARIDSKGACVLVHGVAADATGPLGSAFKLYVLASVADAVSRNELRWDSTIAIRDNWKSLPSGELQDKPVGMKLSVAAIADKMISISDNTAADHLLRSVGRSRVEDTMKATGIADPSKNQPFLTTRDLFVLKATDYPTTARHYLALDERGRRALVDGVMASASLSSAKDWSTPRDVGTLEWFASPMDICRVFAYLGAKTEPSSVRAIDHALTINDGGLKLDRASWPTVWFKGGSEPGVLTLAFLAKSMNGERFVVVSMVSNSTTTFDETATASELEALTKGAFGLIKN